MSHTFKERSVEKAKTCRMLNGIPRQIIRLSAINLMKTLRRSCLHHITICLLAR